MVGTARFELTTSRTPSVRATRLRYVPKSRTLRLEMNRTFVKQAYKNPASEKF
jgi:hypothetical protein